MAGFSFGQKNDAGGGEVRREEYARVIPLDIHDITVSHMNPRHSRGEHYESTKASIRAIGLQSMLTVTKVPGQEQYSLYNGGNTRLSILKELYQEYKAEGNNEAAEKIRTQYCRFVPYTDDIDVLVKHMAENEERSEMTFIDKARAVFQIRELYLHKNGKTSISSRDLVEFIRSLGWTRVNQRATTELFYALESLESVIPRALESGLGRPKVQRIRTWLRDLKIWLEHDIGKGLFNIIAKTGEHKPYTVAQAEALFYKLLADYDDDQEPINVEGFFDDYRLQLVMELQAYQPNMGSEEILFWVEQVAQHGEVPQERPWNEIDAELDATSTFPPPKFPTPRKPREPRAAREASENEGLAEDEEVTFQADVPSGNDVTEAHGSNLTASAAKSALPGTSRDPEVVTSPFGFGPSIKLPARTLPTDRYIAELHKLSNSVLDVMLQIFDRFGAVKAVLATEYTGGDPDCDDAKMLADAPYMTFFIFTHDQYLLVREVLTQGTEAEKYGILYLIHIWEHYLRNVFRVLENGNSEEREAYSRLKQLWEEFGLLYVELQTLVRSGLVYAKRNRQEAEDLVLADTIVIQHTAYIFARESLAKNHQAGGGNV